MVRRAHADPSRALNRDIGGVGNAADIASRTGVDVLGFRRVVGSYGIRHALANHGNRAVELGRIPPQSALRPVDFERIPEIVARGKIVSARPRKKPAPTVEYEATVGRWKYGYVEEIRRAKGQVALVTLWKSKA